MAYVIHNSSIHFFNCAEKKALQPLGGGASRREHCRAARAARALDVDVALRSVPAAEMHRFCAGRPERGFFGTAVCLAQLRAHAHLAGLLVRSAVAPARRAARPKTGENPTACAPAPPELYVLVSGARVVLTGSGIPAGRPKTSSATTIDNLALFGHYVLQKERFNFEP